MDLIPSQTGTATISPQPCIVELHAEINRGSCHPLWARGYPQFLPMILLLVFLSHLSSKPLFQHLRNRKRTGTKNASML